MNMVSITRDDALEIARILHNIDRTQLSTIRAAICETAIELLENAIRECN